MPKSSLRRDAEDQAGRYEIAERGRKRTMTKTNTEDDRQFKSSASSNNACGIITEVDGSDGSYKRAGSHMPLCSFDVRPFSFGLCVPRLNCGTGTNGSNRWGLEWCPRQRSHTYLDIGRLRWIWKQSRKATRNQSQMAYERRLLLTPLSCYTNESHTIQRR